MSEKEWPTLGFSVKGNRREIKATRGEIYEAYTDDQIIELVDRRAIAAKDARIAELDEVLSDIVKLLAVDKKGAYTSQPVRKILDWSARAELAIAAKPARQVGGDVVKEAFEEGFSEGNRQTDDRYHWKGYQRELAESWEASEAKKAALDPSAVVVVMPERKPDLEAMTDHWRENYRAGEADGYNEALDEVARLNRRAIPAGLLERAADMLVNSTHYNPSAVNVAANELRALLGKEAK